MSAPAVVIDGLTRAFGPRVVLDEIDLRIEEGEFVALLGASGSGKTTLLRTLAGLDGVEGGSVFVPERRTVVFQEPRLVPSKRVRENVTLGQGGGKQRDASADAALAEVGLHTHSRAWPGTLSGGEAQRVALARALVREPQLMLLDEPFAALDALTRLKMQDLVADLWRRHGPAVLFVTHDVDEAILLADRIVVLTRGRLSLDEPMSIERPRSRSDVRFEALRSRLLTELGVNTATPAAELVSA